ncbi:DUF2232 domain-containing protein [Phyllobacterium phragmitis]|uniref:DUF2232 domain-containing protein n=1 Tax=Phyllobacterium phragmitis TaxID=2670329 RepID=A0A2S9IZE0_9HYPH|nr:DUF2232 domain-containing protein [Phyllobacterium phragmitis]PRD45897.1 DUF2232 domain-containing protein [Phyllobacterium phragmitis]
MKFDGTSIGVGILAGLAAALMSAGVIAQSGVAMLLYFLTPLPIFIAALGWGTAASLISAIVASIAVALVAAPMAALLVALTSIVPAATGAYLAGLARPADEMGGPSDTLVWYPLSDIIFRLALMVAASFIIIGIIIGFGEELAREVANAIVASVSQADPNFTASNEMRENLAAFMVAALPAIQPATGVLVLVANLYLALRLTALSGRLRRPRDDWPATLRMPRIALAVFAICLVLAFIDGGLGHAAAAVGGALSAGFLLAGFAMMHYRTRGAPWRPFALWLAYLAVVIFAFVLFLFLIAGLFDTSRNAPVSKTSPKTPID